MVQSPKANEGRHSCTRTAPPPTGDFNMGAFHLWLGQVLAREGHETLWLQIVFVDRPLQDETVRRDGGQREVIVQIAAQPTYLRWRCEVR